MSRLGWSLLLDLGLALCLGRPAAAQGWSVDLEIGNGAGVKDTLTFGIHPQGTSGIDPQLGELELPPWPPSQLFEVRFLIPSTEGTKLDVRDTTQTQRFHTIKWQPGTGGYPVTVRWNRQTLPNARLYILDGYGGGFIPPVNMHDVDSLQVPTSKSYVRMLKLDVTPALPLGVSPTIGNFPDAEIYLAQRFADYRLDDYVTDPDTPDSLLQWNASGNQALIVSIVNRVLHVAAPAGWTGTEVVHLLVRDPQQLSDERDVDFTVKSVGLPHWTVPLTARNTASVQQVVNFGIHPDATAGIDASLGEVSLPPWPPGDVFDARMTFPDNLTQSKLDLRMTEEVQATYHLEWQAGQGGYPVTVEWPSVLPEGQFTIEDDLGGAYIHPLDMQDTTRVVIPQEWSFITGLRVLSVPVVDTIPPDPPWDLVGIHCCGQQEDRVRLEWLPGSDAHFGYYEVLYDSTEVTADARWSWDWSEDAALLDQSTTTTTVVLPGPPNRYLFRIRAWDRFGNVSVLSSPVACDVDPVPRGESGWLRLVAAPNPARGLTQLNLWAERASEADVSIFDVGGRLIRNWKGIPVSGGRATLVWNGCRRDGSPIGTGIVFARVRAGGRTAYERIAIVR